MYTNTVQHTTCRKLYLTSVLQQILNIVSAELFHDQENQVENMIVKHIDERSKYHQHVIYSYHLKTNIEIY